MIYLTKVTERQIGIIWRRNEFVDKTVVHAPDRSSGDRTQEVNIYLKFIDKFDVPMPEPTPEDLAEMER